LAFLAAALLQEAEQVVDAKRPNRRLVRAREQESCFALGEPTALPVTADRSVADSKLSTLATGTKKSSHQSKTSPPTNTLEI
jgi:hypothetical protein